MPDASRMEEQRAKNREAQRRHRKIIRSKLSELEALKRNLPTSSQAAMNDAAELLSWSSPPPLCNPSTSPSADSDAHNQTVRGVHEHESDIHGEHYLDRPDEYLGADHHQYRGCNESLAGFVSNVTICTSAPPGGPLLLAFPLDETRPLAGAQQFVAPRLELERPEPPLLMAVLRGDIACARVLLRRKANVNGTNSLGQTSLHICALNNTPNAVEMAKLLIENGADKMARDATHYTSLQLAVRCGNHAMVDAFAEFGMDVNFS